MTEIIPTLPFPFKLSEKTANFIIDILKNENMTLESSYLRIGVTGGGCAGLQKYIHVVTEINESDFIDTQFEIKIVVDPFSIHYLYNIQVKTDIDMYGNIRFDIFATGNHTYMCDCTFKF